MTLRVVTKVETGLGTVSKSIEAITAEDWKDLQEIMQRAGNLWPDANPNIKNIIDIVTVGQPQQDYLSQHRR